MKFERLRLIQPCSKLSLTFAFYFLRIIYEPDLYFLS